MSKEGSPVQLPSAGTWVVEGHFSAKTQQRARPGTPLPRVLAEQETEGGEARGAGRGQERRPHPGWRGQMKGTEQTQKPEPAALERKHHHASPTTGPGSSLLRTPAPPAVASSRLPPTDISKVNSTARKPLLPQPAHLGEKGPSSICSHPKDSQLSRTLAGLLFSRGK